MIAHESTTSAQWPWWPHTASSPKHMKRPRCRRKRLFSAWERRCLSVLMLSGVRQSHKTRHAAALTSSTTAQGMGSHHVIACNCLIGLFSDSLGFWTLFGLFSDSFETPGALFRDSGGPALSGLFRDSFRTLPGFWARRAQETLCRAGPLLRFYFFLEDLSKQGSTPTPWVRVPRDQIQKRALHRQKNPSCIGFAVLGGGLRPWSQTMVSEGARPWGRDRSEFAECSHQTSKATPFWSTEVHDWPKGAADR